MHSSTLGAHCSLLTCCSCLISGSSLEIQKIHEAHWSLSLTMMSVCLPTTRLEQHESKPMAVSVTTKSC